MNEEVRKIFENSETGDIIVSLQSKLCSNAIRMKLEKPDIEELGYGVRLKSAENIFVIDFNDVKHVDTIRNGMYYIQYDKSGTIVSIVFCS